MRPVGSTGFFHKGALKVGRIPAVPGNFDITELFANLTHNWNTLGPALWVLFGIMFGGWLIRKIIRGVKGDD